MSENEIFLSLGANVGDRVANLTNALNRIAELRGTEVIDYSSVYESAPIGYLEQDNFLNMVVQISTKFTPELLLKNIHKIESDLGRIRRVRWGPRTIDIDILYWGATVMKTDTLAIPHPQIESRKFVLMPLSEIAANFKAPPHFHEIGKILDKNFDESFVEMVLPREKICHQPS